MSFTEQPPQPGDHRPEPPAPPPGPITPPPYGSPIPPAPYGTPGIFGPSLPSGPDDYPTYVPMDRRPGFRPGCVTVGVLVAAFAALMMLCGGFSFLYLPSADEAYKNTHECYEVKGEKICGQTNEVMVQAIEKGYGISIETLAVITGWAGHIGRGDGSWRVADEALGMVAVRIQRRVLVPDLGAGADQRRTPEFGFAAADGWGADLVWA